MSHPREALRIAVESLNSDEYLDLHCSVFTPTSFCNLLRRLSVFGLLNFYVADFHDSVGHEFFVQLQKPDKFEWSEQIISIPLFREGRYKALPENFDAKFRTPEPLPRCRSSARRSGGSLSRIRSFRRPCRLRGYGVSCS